MPRRTRPHDYVDAPPRYRRINLPIQMQRIRGIRGACSSYASVRASLAVTIDFHRARAVDTLIILQQTAPFSRDRVTFIESRNSIFGISILSSGVLSRSRSELRGVVKGCSPVLGWNFSKCPLKVLRGTLAFFLFFLEREEF